MATLGQSAQSPLCGPRPVGQAVKTRPFHGCNTSSILVRVTKQNRFRNFLNLFFIFLPFVFPGFGRPFSAGGTASLSQQTAHGRQIHLSCAVLFFNPQRAVYLFCLRSCASTAKGNSSMEKKPNQQQLLSFFISSPSFLNIIYGFLYPIGFRSVVFMRGYPTGSGTNTTDSKHPRRRPGAGRILPQRPAAIPVKQQIKRKIDGQNDHEYDAYHRTHRPNRFCVFKGLTGPAKQHPALSTAGKRCKKPSHSGDS